MPQRPILWTFRRCPYAMRARLAIHSSGVEVELREILLKNKPEPFRAASPKATVPVVVDASRVIEESRDVMLWALTKNDPEGWLDMPAEGTALIDRNDGPFKAALDHTKYAVRYPDLDMPTERQKALDILKDLDQRLANAPFLFGQTPKLADMAILPFVRQFANIDRVWFDSQDLTQVTVWLDRFLASDRFAAVMPKFSPWRAGQPPVIFPSSHS